MFASHINSHNIVCNTYATPSDPSEFVTPPLPPALPYAYYSTMAAARTCLTREKITVHPKTAGTHTTNAFTWLTSTTRLYTRVMNTLCQHTWRQKHKRTIVYIYVLLISGTCNAHTYMRTRTLLDNDYTLCFKCSRASSTTARFLSQYVFRMFIVYISFCPGGSRQSRANYSVYSVA